MITLKEFLELYKPEFANTPTDVDLYTVTKVGNLETSVHLGKYPVTEGKLNGVDMDKMIVEKFTIPDLLKQDYSNVTISIQVSNNIEKNYR